MHDSIVVGIPRFLESVHLPWQRHLDDKPYDDSDADFETEYIAVNEEFDEWLNRRYKTGSGPAHDLYNRGDSWEDKSMQVLVCNSEVFYPKLFHDFQSFLKSGWQTWRIIIPTDNTPENAVIVYDTAIRINEEAEKDLAEFCAQMRPIIKRHSEERWRRFRDAGKPLP